MLQHSIRVRAMAITALLATPAAVDAQGSPPIKRFVGAPDSYCVNVPFKDGSVIQTSGFSIAQAGKWQTGDWLVREVLYPNVKVPVTVYDITIPANTQITIEACGCVQTGGKGVTWKRYVNPLGDNSTRLYHGAVRIPGARDLGLPTSPALGPNFVRISDLMRAQRSGFRWQTRSSLPLALGYEDDDYPDNGYWGHDNGNFDQCKGLQSAAVRILLQHL